MEELIQKNTRTRNLFLATIGVSFALLGVLSFVFHSAPKMLIELLADFSRHHYLIASIILMVAAIVSFKLLSKALGKQSTGQPVKLSRANYLRRRLRSTRKNLTYFFASNRQNGVYSFINNAQLPSLQFESEEVLEEGIDQLKRQYDIDNAVRAGAQFGQKVVICFKANDAELYTIACIVSTNETHLMLKGGALIPINSIYKIEQ